MVPALVTIWSRSIIWRLMAPVGLMLLLVGLLTLVSLGTRARLHRAYDAQTRSQEVRTELIEVRSLSRSLQRDALNLLIEAKRRELAVIQRKYGTRTAEMRRRLQGLALDPGFDDDRRHAAYLASQRQVLDRLGAVAAHAERGDRAGALATFRDDVRPNERAASGIADELIDAQDARVAGLQRRTAAMERQEVLLSSLASLTLFVAAAAATLLIARRSVLSPLSDIERAITLVASGETTGDTPHTARHDEIGRMARAIEVFRGSVRERERLREEREQFRLAEERQEREREQARRRADEAVTARSAALARSARMLEGEIGAALRSLRSSSTQLAATSRELTDHSADARRGLGEVGDAVARAVGGATDIAAATNQFITAIGQASVRTRRSADLGAGAAAQSTALAARMKRLEGAAGAIGAVVNLIAGIAKQTNLLALNASIEAARAGEAGRGFVVVAGEVKQLAGQTADATDDVAGQIAEMQLAARDAGDGLRLIETMIADIARESDLLAGSIGEQAQSGRTINRNVTGAASDLDLVDGRVKEVARVATDVDALAQQVKTDAGRLETAAAAIDRALSAFFADLDTVREAAHEGRAPIMAPA